MSDNTILSTDLFLALDFLHRGDVIAFPTDTVYGLGADATHEEAVEKVYALKGRSSSKSLLLNLSSLSAAQNLAVFSPLALKLAQTFWPGALTLILPLKDNVSLASPLLKLGTIGLRIPAHPLALDLLKHFHHPLISTSANLSGHPPALSAQDVQQIFHGQLPFILDGGPCPQAHPSTIVDMTHDAPYILREGALASSEIFACLNT